jgi:hypothetical protein
MATLEQIQSILDRPRVAPVSDEPSVDLSEVVASLQTIAGELSRAASKPTPDTAPIIIDQSAEMLEAAQAIVRVLQPLAESVKNIELPAPVVNVEAPSVTVERLNAPRVADIVRDENGYMTRIVFSDGEDDESVDDDDGVEIE